MDEKEKNGFLLNKDELWYKDKLKEKKPEFWQNNGLNELKNLVNDKIIQNKGKDLLISNINFIKNAFEKKEVFLNTEINALKTKISQNQKSKDKINKALDEIVNFRNKLDEVQDNFTYNIDDNLAQKDNILKEDIDKKFSGIANNLASKLKNYSSVANLNNNICWDFKNALETEKLAIDELVSKAMEDIKQYTKNETEEFINEMSKFEAFDSDVLRQALRYDTFDIYRDFSVSFLTSDDLSKIYWDNFIWFKDFFFKWGLDTYQSKIEDFTNKMVNKNKEELQKKILENIDKFGKNLCAQVPNSIKTVLHNNQTDLANIKEKGTLNEKELNELILNLNQKENNINKFKEIKENFMKKLENMEGKIYEK